MVAAVNNSVLAFIAILRLTIVSPHDHHPTIIRRNEKTGPPLSFINYQGSRVCRTTKVSQLSLLSSDMSGNQVENKASTHQEDSKPTGCVPCESLDLSSLLSTEKAEKEIAKLILWEAISSESSGSGEEDDVDAHTGNIVKISRTFTARNFQSALDAINAIGAIAEREGHHPDLHLTSYRDVSIIVYTHSVGGLTQNDINLATMIDEEVKIDYSPKWLRLHGNAQFTSKY